MRLSMQIATRMLVASACLVGTTHYAGAAVTTNQIEAGIYTDAGRNGCGFFFPTGSPAAPNSGSEGHYLQDMIQFERWGFYLRHLGLQRPTESTMECERQWNDHRRAVRALPRRERPG